jgi:Thymidylate synthase complementing protein
MQRLALKLGTLTAVGLLSACSGGPQFQQLPSVILDGFPAVGVMDRARAATPSGPFATAAYTDLMKHAEYEYVQGDYKDAMYHANKAIAVASGEAITPQNPSERWLPADKVAEIQDAYGRLNERLADGFADDDPENAGVAIGSFDCWIEQQEENFQPADIAACRDAFDATDRIKREGERAHTFYARLLNERADGTVLEPGRPGLARELARIVLPVNTYTQLYWKIDLHNLLHFISLRADVHAQYEIRAFADVLADIVAKWVPLTAAAFAEYRMQAVTLSATALEVVRRMLAGEAVTQASSGLPPREWRELMETLDRDAS